MYTDLILAYLKSNLQQVFSALLVLTLGLTVLYIGKRVALRWINLRRDPTLQTFLINAIYFFLIVVVFISFLSQLGVPTASLLTLLGASSLAIGLALKDFLSNVAAGFVIIFLRPFKVGDQIDIAGDSGTVSEINLFVTMLKNTKNEVLFIPNGKLINNRILNKNYHRNRQLDIRLSISYDADLKIAKSILQDLVKQHENIYEQPEPTVAVHELADNGIILRIRAWVDSKKFMDTEYELLEIFKNELEKAKISIPYPQLEVMIKKTEPTAPH